MKKNENLSLKKKNERKSRQLVGIVYLLLLILPARQTKKPEKKRRVFPFDFVLCS